MDEYGRGYGYSHHDNQFASTSEDSDSNQDDHSNHSKNVAAITADILHSFPYSKQGGLGQQTASPTFQRPQLNQFTPRFPVTYPSMSQLPGGMTMRPPVPGLGFLHQLQVPDDMRQSAQTTHPPLPSIHHLAAYGGVGLLSSPTSEMTVSGRMPHTESSSIGIGLHEPTNHNTLPSNIFSYSHGHTQSSGIQPANYNHASFHSVYDSSHSHKTSTTTSQSRVTAASLDTSAVYSTSHSGPYTLQQPGGLTLPIRLPAISESLADPRNVSQHTEASNHEHSKASVKCEPVDIATDLSNVKQLSQTFGPSPLAANVAADFSLKQSPANMAAIYSHRQSPATLAADFSHRQSPANMAGIYSHSQSPATLAADFSHRQSPANMAAIYSHSQSPATVAANFSHRQSPANMAAIYSHSQSPATVAADFSHRQSPANMAAIYSHSQSPATVAADFSHSQSPANVAADFSHSQLPANMAADFSHRQSPANVAADFSHRQSPVNAVEDFSHRQSPANMTADFSRNHLPAAESADFSHRPSPVNTTADFGYSQSPSNVAAESSHSSAPANITADFSQRHPPATSAVDSSHSHAPANITADFSQRHSPATSAVDSSHNHAPANIAADFSQSHSPTTVAADFSHRQPSANLTQKHVDTQPTSNVAPDSSRPNIDHTILCEPSRQLVSNDSTHQIHNQLTANLAADYIHSQSPAQVASDSNQSNTDDIVVTKLSEHNTDASASVGDNEHNAKSENYKKKDLDNEDSVKTKQATDNAVKREPMDQSVLDTNNKVKKAIAEVIQSAKERAKNKSYKKKKKVPVDPPVDNVKAVGASHLADQVETAVDESKINKRNVVFLYKGKLRGMGTTVKPIRELMEEPVDSEDMFYENLECYFFMKRHDGSLDHGGMDMKFAGQSGIDGENCEALADEADDDENYRSVSNSAADNWYSSAMKKYADMTSDGNYMDSSLKLTPQIKVGGRSDPDNPFAITSPSFSESAARGIVTTKQMATTTNVMISITSIGSRKKLIPTVVNSEAAEGGLVTVVNPLDDEKDKNSDNASDTDDIKRDKTSILSKLRREKPVKAKEDEKDTELDRLDINIRVDNDQCVSHGDLKRWACKLCYKSYTTKHNLVSHILDHTGIKPHLCLVCGKYFRQLSHLNTHMLTHDKVKPHTCDICDKNFTQISHLKRHMTVHLDSKPYRCDVCMRGFTYPSELRSHREKHVPGKDQCTECGLDCMGTRDLSQHMQTHDSRNNLTCQHCSRVFRFPAQLRDHMMSHSGARPYICTECGMDFMKEHHLKAHQFTHTGLRPYVCPFCTRAFNQKANLARHMLIHNAERAFVCPICDKTFTQPQTLKAHMVVHEDTKPYSCKYCGKQFGRLHNLQGHMHMHNDSKPYVCSICQSSFTLKGNLNRHKKVKHGLSESTENMEEDAVNFLTSLSDLGHDQSASSDDPDAGKDENLSPDVRTPKKGRKSTPRKHVSKKACDKDGEGTKFSESGTELDNYSDDETDNSKLITYSDEERENEARLQFSTENTSSGKPKRKRKRDVSYKVDNINGDAGDDESGGEGMDMGDTTTGNEADGDSNTGPAPTRDKGTAVAKPDKRLRKRKKKNLSDSYLDDFEENYTPQPTKSRKKGAKLDSLIASKFKNIE